MTFKERQNVNKILAEWNPLDVPLELALDEYTSYLSKIGENSKNIDEILKCLENILINELGVDYNKLSKKHSKDLEITAYNIFNVLKKV